MNQSQLRNWIGKHFLLLLFTVFITLPVTSFILGSAILLGYIYWPADYSRMAIPQINPMARHIILIAHGHGDDTASWATPLKATLERENSSAADAAQVIALDWNAYSSSTFRCSVNGMRIGRTLGEAMAKSTELHSVHLIGHSCGAFVVLGLCESLNSIRNDIGVQSTYLDPVSIYGGLNWNYGIKHFGECANFSDAYIDTGDSVSGSNQLIPNTHTFNVTNARKSVEFSMSPHVWPTYYYQQLVKSGTYPNLKTSSDLWVRYPRGKIEQVDALPHMYQWNDETNQ